MKNVGTIVRATQTLRWAMWYALVFAVRRRADSYRTVKTYRIPRIACDTIIWTARKSAQP